MPLNHVPALYPVVCKNQDKVTGNGKPYLKTKTFYMATWTRKQQEKSGNYFFLGQFLATSGVVSELPFNEILCIYQDIQRFVKGENGIDYLQVYTDENGRKLYLIDQLSKEMVESGKYSPLDNHCTLLWANEY